MRIAGRPGDRRRSSSASPTLSAAAHGVRPADVNAYGSPAAFSERDRARDARTQAGLERQRHSVNRDAAADARDEAAERRQHARPTTELALAFAEIATHLYGAHGFDDVLTRIVSAAVSTVRGCDMASVTLREDTGYRTPASTDTRGHQGRPGAVRGRRRAVPRRD